MTVTHVRLDELVDNPDNPRIDLGDIAGLAANINQVTLLQPLLVTRVDDGWMVVDGHRRTAAMRSISYDRPIPVIVDDLDRSQRLLAAVSAGMFTRKLSKLEQAKAMAVLRDELGLTQAQIAQRVGCHAITVNLTLRLLDLDADRQAELEAGRLTADAAIKHLRLTARKAQGRPSGEAWRHRPVNPNEHQVDFKVVLTVAAHTDHSILGRDLAGWLENAHRAGGLPHRRHILSIDDYSIHGGAA